MDGKMSPVKPSRYVPPMPASENLDRALLMSMAATVTRATVIATSRPALRILFITPPATR
jgi:hypothetical protein